MINDYIPQQSQASGGQIFARQLFLIIPGNKIRQMSILGEDGGGGGLQRLSDKKVKTIPLIKGTALLRLKSRFLF